MSGTLALSWGRYGGFYVTRRRVCLGWFAFTALPVELDDLMRAYADKPVGAALDRHTTEYREDDLSDRECAR